MESSRRFVKDRFTGEQGVQTGGGPRPPGARGAAPRVLHSGKRFRRPGCGGGLSTQGPGQPQMGGKSGSLGKISLCPGEEGGILQTAWCCWGLAEPTKVAQHSGASTGRHGSAWGPKGSQAGLPGGLVCLRSGGGAHALHRDPAHRPPLPEQDAACCKKPRTSFLGCRFASWKSASTARSTWLRPRGRRRCPLKMTDAQVKTWFQTGGPSGGERPGPAHLAPALCQPASSCRSLASPCPPLTLCNPLPLS